MLAAIVVLALAITALASALALGMRSSSRPLSTSGANAIASRVTRAVVNIDATIGGTAEAAGTGMIISSSGEALTNNHVIADATDIRVQIGGTGSMHTEGARLRRHRRRRAPADQRGARPEAGAPRRLVASVDRRPGRRARNARGTGGKPAVSTGAVTALNQQIRASDELGNPEILTGMIEISAPIQPGDSGGPLVDAHSQVIGMNTAAAFGRFSEQTTSNIAFAIPIDTALSIGQQIAAGRASATVHIGARGVLGVEVTGIRGRFRALAPVSSGAIVVEAQSGSPAASAGIAPGDVITSVGTTVITGPSDLQTALDRYHPNDRVGIGWVDVQGGQHHATLKLTPGPPA